MTLYGAGTTFRNMSDWVQICWRDSAHFEIGKRSIIISAWVKMMDEKERKQIIINSDYAYLTDLYLYLHPQLHYKIH